MPSSPYDLMLILALVWFVLATMLFRTRGRVRRLERLMGVRPARRRRPKKLPRESHIREVPMRVEKRAG